jgi:hypothetical protein
VQFLGPDQQGRRRSVREAGRHAVHLDDAVGEADAAGRQADRQQVAGPYEVGDEGVGGVAVDVERPADLLDAPLAHHDDAIRHGHGLALVVGDQDGGDAEPLLEQPQLDLHRLAQLGVERGERLVQQQQLRLHRERAGDRDALALPARDLGDGALRDAGQADQFQQLLDPGPAPGRGHAADAQRIGDVVADREMAEQGQRLEHHAELAPVRRHRRDVGFVEQHAAGGRRLQPGDDAQQGGLAAAGRPEEAHQLPGRNQQVDVGHGQHRPVGLAHALQPQRVHRPVSP